MGGGVGGGTGGAVNVPQDIRCFLDTLDSLKCKTVGDFSTTVDQHLFNEAHLVEVVGLGKQAKIQLEDLMKQMRLQRGLKETDRSEQTEIIAKLSGELLEVKNQSDMEKMGLERRTKANDDANAGNHVKAMAGATVDETKTKEAHVNALDAQETREHQLRKLKNKKDMELHNIIGKYDKDLGDLEGKITEDQRAYTVEKSRLAELTTIFSRIDRDKAIEAAEDAADEAERQMMLGRIQARADAVTLIAALVRGVYTRVHELERRSKKKKGRGKKGGKKGKGKKK